MPSRDERAGMNAEQRRLLEDWTALCERIHKNSHAGTAMILTGNEVQVLFRCLDAMAKSGVASSRPAC